MRNRVLQIVFYLIFIIVFNIVFFLLKGNDTAVSVWIAYGFVHLAYAALIASLFLEKRSNEVVLQFSTGLISFVYFVVQLFVGIGIMLIAPDTATAVIVIQAVLLAAYLVVLLPNVMMNDRVIENLETQSNLNKYRTDSLTKIKLLMGMNSDVECKKALERLHDIIHGSQIETTEEAIKTEKKILQALSALENENGWMDREVKLKELDKIITLAEERNILANASKYTQRNL